MVTNSDLGNATQEFLDAKQYSFNSIFRYERIFGHTWVSTGGEYTTKELCLKLNLKPRHKVLDIGCGSGGSAFYMARQYGCLVHGIDLSTNMLGLANDRLRKEEKTLRDRITFEVADITKVELPKEEYDVVYSRDAILHIKDKEALFRKVFNWLKPGGTVFISDYVIGEKEPSPEFVAYLKNRGYHLTTLQKYSKALTTAGFKSVTSKDMSEMFIQVLQDELKYFVPCRESFISDFSIDDYNEIVDGWTTKINEVKNGYRSWGLFMATK